MNRWLNLTSVLVAICICCEAGTGADETVTVFDSAPIDYVKDLEGPRKIDGVSVLAKGQTVETTIDLPASPAKQRDARRIVAHVHVEPVLVDKSGRKRPGDPWTRLGSLSIIPAPAPGGETGEDPEEIEIMRFITPFGGPGDYEQDVTALAPILTDRTTVRLYISTYMSPGWRVSVKLTYSDKGVGFRRPAFAESLFNQPSVTAEMNRLEAEVEIPQGLAQPRIRILSTGHASDGQGGDEFVSRRHVLTIDGKEVAIWRPWAEQGGDLRDVNPTSGRLEIDGRELWSSDLDRSGWHPGKAIEPLLIPMPELTPGEHKVELRIEDIRPAEEGAGETAPHGYWRVSALIVADTPWPGLDDS